VEPIISDLPAAGWPACGRQGEDYMCVVRLRRIEVSRKGKAPPLERGRGKYSPTASPIGLLWKPLREETMGSTENGKGPVIKLLDIISYFR